MLNRHIQFGTQGIQDKDKLESYARSALSTTPTIAHSALQSFTQGALTIPTLGADIQSAFLGRQTPESIGLHETLGQIEGSLRNVDSLGQEAVDFTANLMGSVFSLAPIATEAAGAAAGEAIGQGLARIAPKALAKLGEKEIPKLTLTDLQKETIGMMGMQGLKFGGGFAGFMAPESLEQAYNEETNKFNYGKAAANIGLNGAIGFSLASSPFLSGILAKKVFGFATKEERAALEKISSFDKALEEKRITPEERKWLQDYHENPNDPKVHSKATELLGKEGHNVDSANNKALVEILSEQDAKNIAATSLEQLTSRHDLDQTALSDFIIHNSIDKKRGSSISDGINGWIDHIDDHLSKKEEHLAAVESKIKPTIEEEQSISDIRKGLFTLNGSISKNFRSKPDYYKLDEMANSSPAARHLLDRVHLEEAHNAQKAYKEVLQAFSQLLTSNLAKYTNPERAANYLKSKLEQSIDKPIGKEAIERVAKEETEFPIEPEQIEKSLKELRSQVEESESELAKEDYSVAENRFKQFEKSEGVLKNLIACVTGALNGKE